MSRAWSGPRAVQGLVFLFVLLLGSASVHDAATWVHLKTGEWIARTGALPSADPFSYMSEGARWLAPDWLADSLFYAAYQAAGTWGPVLLKALLLAAAFALLVPLGSDPLLAGGALGLAACGAWPGFTESPGAFDFPLLAALLRVLQGRVPFSAGLAARVAAILAAWGSLHAGGAWVGAGVTAIYAFGRSMAATRTQRLAWAALVGAAALAVWTNPHGRGGEAWSPQWRVGPDLFNVYGLFLIAGAAAAWVCLQEQFFLAVSTMGLAALSIVSPACAPLYLLAAAPLVTLALDHYLERREPTPRRVGGLAALFGVLALSYLVNVTLARGRLQGFGSRQTAQGALEFLDANRVAGRLFADEGSAAYLLWRAAPGRRLFVDPRPGLYARELLDDARRWSERWPAMAAAYRFDYAVVENRGGGYPARALDEDPGWALAYWDDASLVYLRRGGVNEPVLRHGSFELLKPNRLLDPVAPEALAGEAGRARALDESARALTYAPAATLPVLVRACLLERLGDRAKAEALRRLALERGLWKPEHKALHARLLELRGEAGQAVSEYRRAAVAARRAGDPLVESQAHFRIGELQLTGGQAPRARRSFKRAVELDPGNAAAAEALRHASR
ncbi:MAG: hypothetical protein HY554_02675 [Elusimicrobia bacterium]|nr:hypothetical protein [Elusimicrobiota bacterium]